MRLERLSSRTQNYCKDWSGSPLLYSVLEAIKKWLVIVFSWSRLEHPSSSSNHVCACVHYVSAFKFCFCYYI